MATTDSSLSAVDIVEIIMACQKSQVLFTASSLGVFEELYRCGKPMSAAELASGLNLNAEATERLLNACTSLRLFNRTVSGNGTALYQNTVSSNKYLIEDSLTSLKPFATEYDRCVYGRMALLRECVKNGRNVELSDSDMHDFYLDEKRLVGFQGALHAWSINDAEVAARAFDLSKYKTACDLGGGTGAIGLAVAKAWPNLHVTVVDLKPVVDVMHIYLPKDTPINFTALPGDILKADEVPKADLMILCRVIDGFKDDTLTKLLNVVHGAINPGGAVLVLNKLMDEQRTGPAFVVSEDILTLVDTEGRERTAAEYEALLRKHGFTAGIQFKLLPGAPFADAILAHK